MTIHTFLRQSCATFVPNYRFTKRDISCRSQIRYYTTISCIIYLVALFLCISGASASNTIDGHDLESANELLFDQSEPFVASMQLRARSESTTKFPNNIPAPTGGAGESPSTTSSSHVVLQTDSSPASVVLPRPFDGSLGNNFTAVSCPAFFHSVLRNDAFNECIALSLLLQTSTSFFHALSSPEVLQQTLNATCHVNYPQCSALMSSLASQLISSSACGQDYALQNPVVEQAYHGFVAYEPLYHAGCLTTDPPATADSNGTEYCFAAAAANTSAPSNSYVYYLPLGLVISPGTGPEPGCTSCMRDTMNVFHEYVDTSSQPLSWDYAPAAQRLNDACGSRFVSAAVVKTSAATTTPAPKVFLLALLAFVAALCMI